MDKLVEKEMQLHRYEFRTNKQAIAKLLHPDFLEVGKSGRTFNYQAIMGSMSVEKPTDSLVHSQDYECIQLDENVVLVLYKSAVVERSGAVGDFAKRSSIWIKEESQWKLRYHQGTACDEFQIDRL